MPITVITMVTTNTTAHIKRRFEVDDRCRDCLSRTYERLMEKFQVSKVNRELFFQFYNEKFASGSCFNLPQIHRELNREFCRLTGVDDPYAVEKLKSNLITLGLYNDLRSQVIKSCDSFDMALRLSIAGNIMDYGASAAFDIHQTIKHVLESDFAIDHSKELKQRIVSAKKVLYLGDNAGEIVFDKLFIEIIMHNHLTFAVRGSAVLNDVTMHDAEQVEMELVADVISNGYDASSTILDKCSQEFLDIYRSADVIISKGQGNLESLINENDPRIFFLLMVKCEVFAELLGVKKGSFVVYNSCLKIRK
jgi:damage-control phosphatase, subfamily I